MKKLMPIAIYNNQRVRTPAGDLYEKAEADRVLDLEGACIEKKLNPDKDGNEALEYLIISCAEFDLALTLPEIEAAAKRFKSAPWNKKTKKVKNNGKG